MFNRSPVLLHRKVVINLLSGNAVSGVVSHESRAALVLRGAMVHEPGADPASADGEVLIDRANVDFVQII